MINITVLNNNKTELAKIRIFNVVTDKVSGLSDYEVEFAVNTGVGFALYKRKIYDFPRNNFNVLALIKQALTSLTEEELKLDGPISDTPEYASGASDLARRLYRALF